MFLARSQVFPGLRESAAPALYSALSEIDAMGTVCGTKGVLILGFDRPSSGAPTATTAALSNSRSVNSVTSVVNPLLIFACCVMHEACCSRRAA